jgi:mannosyltransferase OCH1-like enzyme
MPVDARPVPKVLHQIWLQGAAAMRTDIACLAKQAERAALASGWQYRLWSDADLMLLPEYAALRSLPPTFMHLADLGRYAILWNEGGLYVDVDTEVNRMPTDGGPLGPLVGAWCMEGNNAVMAAPPRHPFLARVLARAARLESYTGPATQANLVVLEAGPDMRFWPEPYWLGQWRWRYGHHLGSHLSMGSAIPLGDTFPVGAKL